MVASLEYDYLFIFLFIYKNFSPLKNRVAVAYDHLRQSYDSS